MPADLRRPRPARPHAPRAVQEGTDPDHTYTADWATERHTPTPLDEVIEEARRRRAGPPLDPYAVAFPHALALARDMMWREVKDEKRRTALLQELTEQTSRFVTAVTSCETHGDQLLAIGLLLENKAFSGLDLRKRRTGRGPSKEELLAAYERAHPRVITIWKETRNDAVTEREGRLSTEFPDLTPEQAAAASIEKPSLAACIITGAPYGLSGPRVSALLTAARKQQRAKGNRKR